VTTISFIPIKKIIKTRNITKRTLSYYTEKQLIGKPRRIFGSKEWAYTSDDVDRLDKILLLTRRPTLEQIRQMLPKLGMHNL
jgi:DNA-binding transcriptional MerR regulator